MAYTYQYLLKNKLLLNDNIQLIKGFFGDVSRQFKKLKVDLIHIDGWHTYKAVKQDYEDWLIHTHENTIFLFHDVQSFEEVDIFP